MLHPFVEKATFTVPKTHTTTRISLTTLQSIKNNCIKNTLCVTLRANGRNNSQVRLHVDKSLTGFKLWATAPNNTQQHATTCNRVCKRTQHVASYNVASCWPTVLRPFARGFTEAKNNSCVYSLVAADNIFASTFLVNIEDK